MPTTQDCSVGIGRESTYGTGVTPTRWLEFLDEKLEFNPERVQGGGLRVGGRVARSGRRVQTMVKAGGSYELEATTRGMGLLLESCFGGATSTLVSGTTFQQVFTLGETLPAMTVQKGVARENGTIDPYTFTGCVVDSFGFELAQGGILKLKTNIDARNLTTATGYAAPSYPAAFNLFHFAQAALVYGGGAFTAPTTTVLASYASGTSVDNVLDFSLDVGNNITGAAPAIGGAGLRPAGRAPRPGLREIKGKMKALYTDTTLRDAFINDTPMGLLLTFTSTEALSTGFATLQIVLPEVKFDGQITDANGPDVSEIDADFTVLDNLTAAQPIWVVLRTADTTL